MPESIQRLSRGISPMPVCVRLSAWVIGLLGFLWIGTELLPRAHAWHDAAPALLLGGAIAFGLLVEAVAMIERLRRTRVRNLLIA